MLRSSLRRLCLRPIRSQSTYIDIPLSEPLSNIPASNRRKVDTGKSGFSVNNVSTLSNGLVIVTEERSSPVCTLGVILHSGPRYELPYPNGICHMLKKLAFSSTKSFASRDENSKILENRGGILDCQMTRDLTCYAMSANPRSDDDLDILMKVLSESLFHPKFEDSEIESARGAVRNEIDSLNIQPEQEPFLVEMIHAAAYQNNTLGFPQICPVENIPSFNRKLLYTYMKNHYTPQNMVLAAVGINHDKLMGFAEKYFGDVSDAVWNSPDSDVDTNVYKDNSVAQYTGGFVTTEVDLSNIAIGPTARPNLAHVIIGMESASVISEDFLPFQVLCTLLGGGGSFSAGGPGKGMYSRLYTQVLNQYHWIHHCQATTHPYSDSGLFHIMGSAPPNQLDDLTEIIIDQLIRVAARPRFISEDEFNRARAQLRSFLLMNLEMQPVVWEDIARDVLVNGLRKNTPNVIIDKINALTVDDVHRVANNLLSSKVSVAARGDLRKLPTYDYIQSAFIDRRTSEPAEGIKSRVHWFR